MLTEPTTGLSLKHLSELELDKPSSIPNLQGLIITPTKQPDKYQGTGVKLPQIPNVVFIISEVE